MTNDAIPYYEPATAITAQVGSAVTGKRFVAVSADRQAGPALNTSSTGGNIVVGPCGAGLKALGVAARDQGTGGKVKVYVQNVVVPVTIGAGGLTAGQEVQSDATGQAVAFTTGIKKGIAIASGIAGADGQILLYP
jgi:hypothetical protein